VRAGRGNSFGARLFNFVAADPHSLPGRATHCCLALPVPVRQPRRYGLPANMLLPALSAGMQGSSSSSRRSDAGGSSNTFRGVCVCVCVLV
jgi:hypothetical protein